MPGRGRIRGRRDRKQDPGLRGGIRSRVEEDPPPAVMVVRDLRVVGQQSALAQGRELREKPEPGGRLKEVRAGLRVDRERAVDRDEDVIGAGGEDRVRRNDCVRGQSAEAGEKGRAVRSGARSIIRLVRAGGEGGERLRIGRIGKLVLGRKRQESRPLVSSPGPFALTGDVGGSDPPVMLGRPVRGPGGAPRSRLRARERGDQNESREQEDPHG